MTCNFIYLIDFEESVRHLSKVPLLEKLHLMGNPCMDWAPAEDIVIALIP